MLRGGPSGQNAGGAAGAERTKIREEELVKKVEAAYVATYVFDVRDLTTTPPNLDPSRRNRILDIGHVNHLKELLKVGVRRYYPKEYLDVIVDDATAKSLLSRVYRAAHPEAAQGAPPSEDALREFERNLRMRVLAPEMTIAVKPPSRGKVRLANGQHRIAALLSLIKETAAKSKVKPEPSDYYWPANVYVEEKLDLDAMTFLETNKNPLRKEDSNGYVAVRLLGRYLALDDAEREIKSVPAKFAEWVQEVFQLDVSKQTTRIMPIIRHPNFRETFYQFCSTRYGEKHFTWTLAQKIVGSKLDEIWLGQFHAFNTFCLRIFGSHASDIAVDDWVKVLELQPGRPDMNLRLLFFPEKADYWNEEKGEPRRKNWPLDPHGEFPKLQQPFEFNKNSTYQYRRPLFLPSLTDAQYIRVFTNLRKNRDLYCPTWAVLARLEDHVSSRVKNILSHVMSWVIKDWKPPSTAHNDRKGAKWSDWVRKYLFERSTLIDGGARPYDEAATVEFLQARALKFVEELWALVELDGNWRDTKVTKEQLPFGQLPGWTEFDREDVPEDISGRDYPHILRYMDRFKMDCWARVIYKVIQFAGPCLDGWMSRFNDPQYLENFIRPFNPFGALTTTANYEKNRLISKVPCLKDAAFRTSLQEFGDVAGALWFYASVKQVIKNTLTYGFKYNSRRHTSNRPSQSVIEDKDTFAEAKNLLKSYSIILSQCGYENDPDDWNEDLGAFRLVHSSEKRPAQPLPKRAGVMSEEPRDFVLPEDLTREGYDQARATLGRETLQAMPNPQTPTNKRPVVQDEDTLRRSLEEQRKRRRQESPTPTGPPPRPPPPPPPRPQPPAAPVPPTASPTAPSVESLTPPTDGPVDNVGIPIDNRSRSVLPNEVRALLNDPFYQAEVLSRRRQ